MVFCRISNAELNGDDEIEVDVVQGNGGKMKMVMTETDVTKALQDLNISRFSTKAHKRWFCMVLKATGRADLEVFGDHEPLEEAIKDAKRRVYMGKTNKTVEWKIEYKDMEAAEGSKDAAKIPSIEVIDEKLMGVYDKLQDEIGKGNFKGWKSLEFDDDEHLVVVGAFRSQLYDRNEHQFNEICRNISTRLGTLFGRVIKRELKD